MLAEIDSITLKFEERLSAIICHNLALDIDRCKLSRDLCELSFEYWISHRQLLINNRYPAAIVIARAQFESIVKAIWILNCATNDSVFKLNEDLDGQSEACAKNMPGVNDMMNALKTGVHKNAYDALVRFKMNSWNALNSYTHAGIHPISRLRSGYPDKLICDVYKNSNGLAAITAMHIVILNGRQYLQKEIIALSEEFKSCMPTFIDNNNENKSFTT